MPEVICNTSPLQYLHQLGLLELLPSLAGSVTVPPAVGAELAAGRALGIDLPIIERLAWVIVRGPKSAAALPLATDLGAGEAEVLALACEAKDPLVILDDRLARRVAAMLGIPFRGTLGLLLDGKKIGRIALVAPLLDNLRSLGFRIDDATRREVLALAGEAQ